MSTETHSPMVGPVRGLLPWALAGLVGPAVAYAGVWSGLPWLVPGAFVLLLYPTWLFGWFVMGTSNAVGFIVLSATVAGNVVIFTVVGAVYRRLAGSDPARRVEIAAAAYFVIYVAVTIVAYQWL